MSPTRRLPVIALVLVSGAWCAHDTPAQTFDQRMEDYRARRAARQERRVMGVEESPQSRYSRRLERRMSFDIDDLPARDALEQWSARTAIPLVIDWDAMKFDGIDERQPVTITFDKAPAEIVLLSILNSMSTQVRFVCEVESFGLLVRTRDQANADTVVRLYDVRDLVIDVPDFSDAPSMSLTDALSNTSSAPAPGSGGGGASGGGGGIFEVRDPEDAERSLTKRERGELLARMVMDLIEPDVWVDNGGQHSNILYRRGMLIVKAPKYVHAKIGRPSITVD